MFSSLLAICRFLFPFPFSFAAQGLLGLFFLTLWQCFWSHLKHKQFFEPRISQQCSLCCRKTILAWYFLQNKKLDWIRHWNSATNTKTSEKTLLWLNLLILKLRHYYMSQAIDQLWNVWFSVILMSFSDRELGCWSKKKKSHPPTWLTLELSATANCLCCSVVYLFSYCQRGEFLALANMCCLTNVASQKLYAGTHQKICSEGKQKWLPADCSLKFNGPLNQLQGNKYAM